MIATPPAAGADQHPSSELVGNPLRIRNLPESTPAAEPAAGADLLGNPRRLRGLNAADFEV
ncbi:hypothetical protein [Nakamurella leprariae]|uniref:Uncharacterized protein n=1 Tax=Nakamurella leprariae TaxID=2803911 RepID=A0A939C0I1_9ACTN|nr:hypothetical protein [Nakamurella leprariae]MBM9469255.1 hypothetical protein [Nakamurella leprariae]